MPSRSATRRRTPFPLLISLAGLLGLALGAALLAQAPSQKPPREEEDVTPIKPKRNRPLRVDDDDPAPAKQRPADAVLPVVDLARAAEGARNPLVRDLFRGLAVPHDRLHFSAPPRTDFVEPLHARYLVLKPGRSVAVKVRRLNSKFEADGTEFTVSLTKDHGITYYEQHAIERVHDFLKEKLENEPPGSRKHLSRDAMLREAERVLGSVLRFHESARERGIREGDGWDAMEKQLRSNLRDVQLAQLALRVLARDWDGANALGAALARNYPQDHTVQAEYAGVLAKQAEQSVKEEDYRTARLQVERFLEQFPDNKLIEPLLRRLQDRAANLLREAQRLDKNGKKEEAAEKLRQAEAVWPYSAELRSYRITLGSTYSVLQVGVRSLPKLLSPATACTEVEKQALDLLFESLVRYRANASGGPRYEPVLAADMPRLTPLGREFQLRRSAYWSDGLRVSAPDVRYTARLLADKEWAGHLPAWTELLGHRSAVSVSGDAFQVKLTLGQGYLDPLSLMTFKVLPQFSNLPRADDAKFARNPLGSGPYRLEAVEEERTRFLANSYYGARPDKSGLPRIGDIRFLRPTNAATEFQTSRLHLLLDPPTAQLRQLQDANAGVLRYETLRNRRVWFLAVNHERPVLANDRLRRALAHAINRESILNECFRAGFGQVHRPLNGPYPPDSWAHDPNAGPADLFKQELARPLAKDGLAQRSGATKLKLLYPAGMEEVQRACEMIRKQVQDLDVGLDLELLPRGPAELRREVEELRQYDLAYYSWDYPDQTFWLWPLFDPRGGRNYLNYRNDPELESRFRRLQSHRDFTQVQKLTREIHEHFLKQMPFIPLWQLDTHLVIHPSLQLPPGPLDPHAVFSDVDQWKLEVR